MTGAPVSWRWRRARGRRSGPCPLVPSEGGREGPWGPRACSRWGGDSARVLPPAGPWDPAGSEGFCCARAGWGASVRPPVDPGKQAGGEKVRFEVTGVSELSHSMIKLLGHHPIKPALL